MKYPSKTFFTADLHFNHKSIIKHCNRPFNSLAEMDQTLINNWNEIVKPGCTVYIIGDFAWKDHAKYANRLNGKKILITGNHDKMSHDAMKPFTEVHPFLVRRFFGHEVTLCHYALKVWPASHYGSWQLYGHSHGRIKETKYLKGIDVGVDVWGFRPVPYEVLKALMDTKDKKPFHNTGEVEQNVIANRSEHLNIWDNYEKHRINQAGSESMGEK